MIAVYVARLGEAGRDWEFLQLRRADDDYMGGTWSTVYGIVEAGEAAWQAAARELWEEAGLKRDDFFRLPAARSFYTSYNDTLWTVPAFLARVGREATVALNAEHTAYRWVRRDYVDASFLWVTDREAIADACRDILSPDAPARELLRIQ
jgi:dATP pyrophosphohydrolase